ISSGDLKVEGAVARYELRMPLYEVAHVQDPETTLFEHFRLVGAKLTSHDCRADTASDTYLCRAEFHYDAPADRVDVECTFARVTVPNRVHMLRAEMDGRRDQVAFDLSFTRETLRFRPPTPFETAATEAGAGAARAWGGAVQILFLAALV